MIKWNVSCDAFSLTFADRKYFPIRTGIIRAQVVCHKDTNSWLYIRLFLIEVYITGKQSVYSRARLTAEQKVIETSIHLDHQVI